MPLRGTEDRLQLLGRLDERSKLVVCDEGEDTHSAIAAFEVADSSAGTAATWRLPAIDMIRGIKALDSSKFGEVLDPTLDAPAELTGVLAVQYVLERHVPAVAQADT